MNSTKIMRSDDLRAQNRHRILRTLRAHGPLTRAEVGRRTELSQAALSTLFGMMTEQGIVTSKSHSEEKQKRGRPKTTVALDPTAGVMVTVALTIDLLSFCLVNYAGETLDQANTKIKSKALEAKELTKLISSGVTHILKSQSSPALKAICLGFQGVTDSASGDLVWSPIISVKNLPIGKLLKKKFNVPVIVNNDCGLIAKALHQQESEKLGDSFAVVLFSHGIGLGLYLGGEPFTGAYTSALEIGHIQFEKDGALCRCGKHGCIEAYAADYGIVRSAEKTSPKEIPVGKVADGTIEKLVAAANGNSKPEKEAFRQAGKAIGFGLATVFTLLDPLTVALVGRNTNAVTLMRTEIENALTTVSRGPDNYNKMVHSYSDDAGLLRDGLALEAMLLVDKVFAENADESMSETDLV